MAAEKPVSEYRHKSLAELNIFPSGDDLAGQFAQLGGQPPQQQQRAFNGGSSSTNYFSQSAFYTSSSVNSSGVNRSQNAPRNASMTQQSHQQFPPQLPQRNVVVVQPQPTHQPPPQKSNGNGTSPLFPISYPFLPFLTRAAVSLHVCMSYYTNSLSPVVA